MKPFGGADDAAGDQALDIRSRVPQLGEDRRRIGADAGWSCRTRSWASPSNANQEGEKHSFSHPSLSRFSKLTVLVGSARWRSASSRKVWTGTALMPLRRQIREGIGDGHRRSSADRSRGACAKTHPLDSL